jgi:hypothetical protein
LKIVDRKYRSGFGRFESQGTQKLSSFFYQKAKIWNNGDPFKTTKLHENCGLA